MPKRKIYLYIYNHTSIYTYVWTYQQRFSHIYRMRLWFFVFPFSSFLFFPFLSTSSDECCTVSAKVRHYGQRPCSACAVAKSGNEVKPTCAGKESAKFSIPMFSAHCGRRLRNCWGSSANHHIQLIRPLRCSDQKQS